MRRPFIALCFLLPGCAPMGEAEIAEREYQRAEFRAEFLEYRRICRSKSGTVVIRSHRRIPADRVARPGDRYHCEVP